MSIPEWRLGSNGACATSCELRTQFFFSHYLNLQVLRPFLILKGAKVVEIGHINNIGSINNSKTINSLKSHSQP